MRRDLDRLVHDRLVLDHAVGLDAAIAAYDHLGLHARIYYYSLPFALTRQLLARSLEHEASATPPHPMHIGRLKNKN